MQPITTLRTFMKNYPARTFAVGLFVIIVLFILIKVIYSLNELSLINKYRANPEFKRFIEFIETNKRDLASNPNKYKRIAATMDMGLQWYNLREYKLAVKWWEKGLAIEPKNPIGWYNLGNAYRELRKYEKAEEAYMESMEYADVGEIDACLGLGELYKYNYTAKSKKEDNVYLECLEKHKENRDLIARLALYYRDTGNKKKAIFYFDKLFSIDPSSAGDVGEELRKLRMMSDN